MDQKQKDHEWAKQAVERFLRDALRGIARQYEHLARLYGR